MTDQELSKMLADGRARISNTAAMTVSGGPEYVMVEMVLRPELWAIDAAVEAEREACAVIADSVAPLQRNTANRIARRIADRIRVRGRKAGA